MTTTTIPNLNMIMASSPAATPTPALISPQIQNQELQPIQPIQPQQQQQQQQQQKEQQQNHLKHNKRYCRIEGCTKTVKSQGLCQRHGAKPKNCKVEGCTKQRQGNFDGMCKFHFKAIQRAKAASTTTTTVTENSPLSVADHPPALIMDQRTTLDTNNSSATTTSKTTTIVSSVYDDILPRSIAYIPQPDTVMPLVQHLKDGFDTDKPPAWHRNEERIARGLTPITSPASQLEAWERELVWMEILLLTGAPGASFRHLARSWGRDKGFQSVLAQFICKRHGDVHRKKRSLCTDSQSQSPKKAKRAPNRNGEKTTKQRPSTKASHERSSSSDDFDIWDGGMALNEQLVSEIFTFSTEEFCKSSAGKVAFEDDEESSQQIDQPSIPNESDHEDLPSAFLSQAVMTAILGADDNDNNDQMDSNSIHSSITGGSGN